MNIRKVLSLFLSFVCGAGVVSGCTPKNMNSTSASQQNIKAGDILKMMKKDKSVVISDKHIVGSFKLHEAGEGAKALDVSPSYVDCEIVFVNCVFDDDVIACETVADGRQILYSVFSRNVTFRQCIFQKPVNFHQCQFAGRACFDGSVFKDNVDMGSSSFDGGVSFAKSSFELEVSFQNMAVSSLLSLLRADFRYNVNFQSARINCDGIFIDASFGGFVDLSNSYVCGALNFTNAVFASRVECIGGYFAGNISLNKCKFNDMVTVSKNIVVGNVGLYAAHLAKALVARENRLLSRPDIEDLTYGEGFSMQKSDNVIMNRLF